MAASDVRRTQFSRLIDLVIDILAVAAGFLICALAVLILVVVLSRHFDLFSITFTIDVIEYVIYLVTMLAAPWVLRERGHISVDLVVQALPPHRAQRLLWAANLVSAVICAVLIYYSVKVVAASYMDGTVVHRSIVFDEWIILLPLPVTFFLLFCILVRWLVRPVDIPASKSDGL